MLRHQHMAVTHAGVRHRGAHIVVTPSKCIKSTGIIPASLSPLLILEMLPPSLPLPSPLAWGAACPFGFSPVVCVDGSRSRGSAGPKWRDCNAIFCCGVTWFMTGSGIAALYRRLCTWEAWSMKKSDSLNMPTSPWCVASVSKYIGSCSHKQRLSTTPDEAPKSMLLPCRYVYTLVCESHGCQLLMRTRHCTA